MLIVRRPAEGPGSAVPTEFRGEEQAQA